MNFNKNELVLLTTESIEPKGREVTEGVYGLRIQKDFNLKTEILEYEDRVRHNGFKYPKTIGEFSDCCLELIKGFVEWITTKSNGF